MKGISLYLASLAAFGTAVNAVAFEPRATFGAMMLPLDGFTPQPTPPPSAPELLRRQSEKTTFLIAPDNTCGFVSGRAGAAYTCGRGGTCVFYPAMSSRNGAVACCNTVECAARATCYDNKAVSSSSLCNAGCLVDAFTLKCTDATAPYCNTISFPGDIFDFWCNSVEISQVQAAQTTPAGATSDRVFSPYVPSDSPDTTSKPLNLGGTTRPASSTSTTDPNGNTGGGSSGSSTPVGAIVGGVVGGVAVIGIVCLVIFFILRRKKASTSPAVAPPPQQPSQYPPPMQQQSPPPFNGTTPVHSVYDPNYGAKPIGPDGQPLQYSPQYGTPPQQYQQAPPVGGYFPQGTAPDRNMNTSPTVSHVTNNRHSFLPTSPTPSQQGGFQQQGIPPYAQQQPTIYEAGGNAIGEQDRNPNHRGNMHELG